MQQKITNTFVTTCLFSPHFYHFNKFFTLSDINCSLHLSYISHCWENLRQIFGSYILFLERDWLLSTVSKTQKEYFQYFEKPFLFLCWCFKLFFIKEVSIKVKLNFISLLFLLLWLLYSDLGFLFFSCFLSFSFILQESYYKTVSQIFQVMIFFHYFPWL